MALSISRICKQLRFAALLSAAPVVIACNTPRSGPSADSNKAQAIVMREAVHDTIAGLLKDFTAKMNGGDFDGVGEYYSDDSSFYWIEGAAVRYRSAKEVRAAMESLKRIPEIELKYYETKIDVLSPTIVAVRTEFSQTFKGGADGRGTTYGGILTITFVREADRWRMLNGHTSSRFPRP